MQQGLLHHSGVAAFVKLSGVKEKILLHSVTLTELSEGFQVVNLKREGDRRYVIVKCTVDGNSDLAFTEVHQYISFLITKFLFCIFRVFLVIIVTLDTAATFHHITHVYTSLYEWRIRLRCLLVCR